MKIIVHEINQIYVQVVFEELWVDFGKTVVNLKKIAVTRIRTWVITATTWGTNHYTITAYVAEEGFDPSTSGLWAQHASAAPLCWKWESYNDKFKTIYYILSGLIE